MMRRHFSTIDTKTGKELILSQCSYNLACHWLANTLRHSGLEIYKTETYDGLVYIWTGLVSVDGWGRSSVKSKRMFFYDEERGYLLGE